MTRPPTPHVMLVDDEDLFLRLGKMVATQAGVELTLVDSGRMAVERAIAQRFDLILMDVSMPTIDGPGATKMIRRLEQESGLSRTPIVAITSHIPSRIRTEMEGVGMDDVVSKPITLEVLRQLLQRHDVVPPSPPPTPLTKVVDLTDLQRLCVNQRDMKELLEAFREGVTSSVALTERGLREGVVYDIQRGAHSLKGLYAQVGGRAASRLMEEIETHVRETGVEGVAPLWSASSPQREQAWNEVTAYMIEEGLLAE